MVDKEHKGSRFRIGDQSGRGQLNEEFDCEMGMCIGKGCNLIKQIGRWRKP